MAMKEIMRSTRLLVSVGLFILVVSVLMLFRPRIGNQEGTANAFADRLEQIGVPIKSIQILKQSPLQIEIVLLSSSNSDTATQEDLWNKHLASREAELAYLTRTRVDSYRLTLVNTKGEIIS
jgi:hypothetical protein